MTRKIAVQITPPVSPARAALFAEYDVPPSKANSLHEQLEARFNDALKLYDMKPTGDHDGDGNNLLRFIFNSERQREERYQRHLQEEQTRSQRRDERREDTSKVWPVESWTDANGEMVKVGDEILFMTLYGYRIATVKSMRDDIDFNHPHPGMYDITPVIIMIDPMQVGPVQAFQPVTALRMPSTYGVRKLTPKVMKQYNAEKRKHFKPDEDGPRTALYAA